jgi:hypothetical protein
MQATTSMFPRRGRRIFFTNFGLYGATDTTTGKVVWKIRIACPIERVFRQIR